MLSSQKRQRIDLLKSDSIEKPDDYITTFNDGITYVSFIINNFTEYYSINVDGIRINTVFTKDF